VEWIAPAPVELGTEALPTLTAKNHAYSYIVPKRGLGTTRPPDT
jgi:hypothetical protein